MYISVDSFFPLYSEHTQKIIAGNGARAEIGFAIPDKGL